MASTARLSLAIPRACTRNVIHQRLPELRCHSRRSGRAPGGLDMSHRDRGAGIGGGLQRGPVAAYCRFSRASWVGWSPLLCCLTIELISRRNASARTNRTGRRRTERAGDTQRAGRSPGRSRGEASADHRSLAEDSAGGSSAGDQTSDGPVRRGQGHQCEERESTRCLPTSSCSASWPDPSR